MDLAKLERSWRNRQRPQRAERIGSLLAPARSRFTGKKGKQLAEVSLAWAEVVPDTMRDNCVVLGLRRGELRLAVGTPADVYMIQTINQGILVSSLNALLGSVRVERIRCELGHPMLTQGRDKKA